MTPMHAGLHVVLIVPDNELTLAVSVPVAVMAHVLSVGLIGVNAPAGRETLTARSFPDNGPVIVPDAAPFCPDNVIGRLVPSTPWISRA